MDKLVKKILLGLISCIFYFARPCHSHARTPCTPDIFPTGVIKGFCASLDELDSLSNNRFLEISTSLRDCAAFDGSFCCYDPRRRKLQTNSGKPRPQASTTTARQKVKIGSEGMSYVYYTVAPTNSYVMTSNPFTTTVSASTTEGSTSSTAIIPNTSTPRAATTTAAMATYTTTSTTIPLTSGPTATTATTSSPTTYTTTVSTNLTTAAPTTTISTTTSDLTTSVTTATTTLITARPTTLTTTPAPATYTTPTITTLITAAPTTSTTTPAPTTYTIPTTTTLITAAPTTVTTTPATTTYTTPTATTLITAAPSTPNTTPAPTTSTATATTTLITAAPTTSTTTPAPTTSTTTATTTLITAAPTTTITSTTTPAPATSTTTATTTLITTAPSTSTTTLTPTTSTTTAITTLITAAPTTSTTTPAPTTSTTTASTTLTTAAPITTTSSTTTVAPTTSTTSATTTLITAAPTTTTLTTTPNPTAAPTTSTATSVTVRSTLQQTTTTTTETSSTTSSGAPLTCRPSDVITQANGNTRNNWFPNAGIDKSRSFTQKWMTTLLNQEQFYAQPLVYCGRVIVVGMQNNIYAVDAATGMLLNTINLGVPYNIQRDQRACADITPFVGMLATPVIDPVTNTLYVTYATYTPGTTGGIDNCMIQMGAFDVFTLQSRPNFPVAFGGTKNEITFNAGWQMTRPGLLLLDGKLYVPFASHCDLNSYHGWVFKIDAKSGTIDDMLLTSGTNTAAAGAGIWQAGTGASSDRSGRVFVACGNAFGDVGFDDPIPGKTPPQVTSEAAVRINTDTMLAEDFFTPADVDHLDDLDLDFGTSGLVLLPPQFGTASAPNLGMVTGKDGFLYVLNADNLGGFQQGPNEGDAIVQKPGPFGTLIGAAFGASPSIWPGDLMVYLTPSGGPLWAFKRTVDPNTALPRFDVIGQTTNGFTFGGPPIVVSNGSTPGSASVWLLDHITGFLFGYDSFPTSDGILPVLFTASTGNVTKFSSPTATNGMIYVATKDGNLFAFGMQ